jgi:hypothetical protein
LSVPYQVRVPPMRLASRLPPAPVRQEGGHSCASCRTRSTSTMESWSR